MRHVFIFIFLCLSTSTATTDFIVSPTPVSSFLHGVQQIRIWSSPSNHQLVKPQWQFRYDPIFSPVVNESGQILITTKMFTEKDWRTSFVIKLDDATARTAAISHLQSIYSSSDNIYPGNVFALAVSSLTVTIPDILDSYLNTTLVGKKPCPKKSACYINSGTSFRIQFSSPSQEIAKEIERVIPVSVIYYEVSPAARYSSGSQVLFTYDNLKGSPFYEALRGRAKITYVSRHDLRNILMDSLWGALTDTKRQEEINNSYANALKISNTSTHNFDEQSWALTYKSNLMHPSNLSVELMNMFVYDIYTGFYSKNPAYLSKGTWFDEWLGVPTHTVWMDDGLKQVLQGKGIDVDIRSDKITVNSVEIVKIIWTDCDQPKSVHLDPISGLLDLYQTPISSHEVSVQIQKGFETKVLEMNSVLSEKLLNVSETMYNIEELVKGQTKSVKNIADIRACNIPWFTNCGKTGCFCYLIVDSRLDWEDANSNCQNSGAELASIHSVEENEFVVKLRDKAGHTGIDFWVGLKNRAIGGTFIWSDGTPVDYENWDSDLISSYGNTNSCVRILGDTSYFQELDCDEFCYSVCKKLVTYF